MIYHFLFTDWQCQQNLLSFGMHPFLCPIPFWSDSVCNSLYLQLVKTSPDSSIKMMWQSMDHWFITFWLKLTCASSATLITRSGRSRLFLFLKWKFTLKGWWLKILMNQSGRLSLFTEQPSYTWCYWNGFNNKTS